MNCPNCGAILPEGSTFCSSCGFQFASANPNYNMNYEQAQNPFQPNYQQMTQNPYQQAYQQQAQNPYQQPMQNSFNNGVQARPAKQMNSSTKIFAIAALLIAAVLIIFLVFSNNHDGNYKCTQIEEDGVVYHETEVDIIYGNHVPVLKVKGNDCSIDDDHYEISINGDKVKIVAADGTFKGTYDKDEKTITIDIDGTIYTFTKQ